ELQKPNGNAASALVIPAPQRLFSIDSAPKPAEPATTFAGAATIAQRPLPAIASPIDQWFKELHAKHQGAFDGALANYIPELTKADPARFGIALATADGRVYEVGDSQTLFTIQSISKPLVYGLALEDNGSQEVLRRVGVEPT